ncbi:hypothetical protein [Bosea sp. (in: a-proteobacteria)]|uniref:hypothetical protein n=1 Tax=Bosea sp. (in: a-proteobacteria) TaxID=1871050 RepID=UPI002FC74814
MIGKKSSERAWAGLGVLLFAACGVLLAVDHFSARRHPAADAESCEAKAQAGKSAASDESGKLRILEVWPGSLRLGDQLCIVAAGVSSQANADALAEDLAKKRAAMAARSTAFKLAQSAAAGKAEEALQLDSKVEDAVAAGQPVDAIRRTAAQARSQADTLVKSAGSEEQKYREAVAEVNGARIAAEQEPAPVRVTLFLGGKRAGHLHFDAAATSKPQPLLFRLDSEFDGGSDAGRFWRDILAGATQSGGDGRWNDRYRRLSVGLSRLEGASPEARTSQSVDILIYRLSLVGLGGAAAATLLIALVLLARSTTLLRDHAGKDEGGLPQAPYSLARSQLAMWGALVFFGFIFIWLTLGHVNGILNTNLLLLLGISATTGLMATQMPTRSAAPAAPDGAPAPVAEPPKSQGFFKDILHDGAGPTLPRIQMLAWSVLLAVIFVWNLATGFAFTDFDTNLLIMLGIAGGSYVAFKPVEAAAPVTAPAAAPAAAPGQAVQPAQGDAAGEAAG